MFIMGITIMFILFLIVISVGVFSSKPQQISSTATFNKPKITIDMQVFDSDQFKNLQAFAEMQVQYSYTAVTQDRQTETGFVSAVSLDQAKQTLINRGLTIIQIKEAQIGRSNPFVPYSQPAVTPVPAVNQTTATK